jgi:RNA 2',3'-cyclic 3'-phosphodiesterase
MSRSATARLFVAIDPPTALREQLAAWARLAAAGTGDAGGSARGTRRVRLLEPETMHLTLCFLGSCPVGELAAIAAAVEGVHAPCAKLALGAPLWLPPRRPRTLALAVHDRAGELSRLHETVVAAISGATGWRPERRRFRAHVTVARLGRECSRGQRAGDLPLAPTPQLSFTARELVLYRSWLAPAGASYEALATRGLSESSDVSSADGGGVGEEPGAP